jgi:hypothetical protein
MLEQVSRPAALSGITMPGGFAQIIDNLVGCSKEELVSTLSKPECGFAGGEVCASKRCGQPRRLQR